MRWWRSPQRPARSSSWSKAGPIKAFGVALKDMKKGETASLIVAPECEAPACVCHWTILSQS